MKNILIPQTSNQLSMFQPTWAELEKTYHNLRFHANCLYQENLLSFNPMMIEKLDDNQVHELIFLRTLFFLSGLPREFAVSMLQSNLQKPYCYSLKTIIWDFENCRWIPINSLIEESGGNVESDDIDDKFRIKQADKLDGFSNKDEYSHLRKKKTSNYNEERLSVTDCFALDYLISFFEELIIDFRKYEIPAWHLAGISKALALLENFMRYDYIGCLRIDAAYRDHTQQTTCQAITIYSDEINLLKEGFSADENGGDSYSDEYVVIGFGEDEMDILSIMDEWKNNFLEKLVAKSPGLIVTDEVEGLEEIENEDMEDESEDWN